MSLPICVICATRDEQPLYTFFDEKSNENCIAHEECGEDNEMEQVGDEPVN